MPTERLAMRRVRDVIRMKAAGLPSREIARRMGAAPSTVRLTIRRFEAAGLSWPLPDWPRTEFTSVAVAWLPAPSLRTNTSVP